MFYGKFDAEKRSEFKQALHTMRQIFGSVYAQDNLIALQRSAGFRQNQSFKAAFEQHAQSVQEKSLSWRLHTLTWAAEHCLSIAGDFVECGVFRGFSFAVVTDYLKFETVDKQLYLYDSFTGIPKDFNSENRSNAVYDRENATNQNAIYDHVTQVFSKYENVKIIKGVIPESFAVACPDQISLLHIDLNSTKSELATLEALFEKVTPGGLIIFDDYGWSGYVKQKVAEDKFMAIRGHQILELPTGQGLLIKKANSAAT